MIAYINDGKLGDVFVTKLDNYSTDVQVKGNIPSTALFEVHLGDEYWIPLKYNGDFFEGKIILSEVLIAQFQKTAPSIPVWFVINGVAIEGGTFLDPDYRRIKANGRSILESDYRLVLLEIARLTRKLDTYMRGQFTKGIEIPDMKYVKAGMVPFALDDLGHVMWDFPFKNIDTDLKSLAEGVLKLSESVTDLTKRLTDLELQFVNHVNGDVIGGGSN